MAIIQPNIDVQTLIKNYKYYFQNPHALNDSFFLT